MVLGEQLCRDWEMDLGIFIFFQNTDFVKFSGFVGYNLEKVFLKKGLSNLQAILASSPTVTTLLQYFVTSNMAELGEMVIRKPKMTKTIFILSKFSSSVNGKNSVRK